MNLRSQMHHFKYIRIKEVKNIKNKFKGRSFKKRNNKTKNNYATKRDYQRKLATIHVFMSTGNAEFVSH